MSNEWTSPDGRIRLINADCLKARDSLPQVDAVISHPPYGIKHKSGGGTGGKWAMPEGICKNLAVSGGFSMIWTGEHVTIKRAGTSAETLAGSNHNTCFREQGIMADSQLTREFATTEEVFKEIPGFPGYEVGTNGTVRSWWNRTARPRRRADKPTVLKTTLTYGYPGLELWGKSVKVHILVLTTFVGPCPEGMEACHNNGVRSDARLENLRWDTRKSNHADKRKHNTNQSGERGTNSKLTNAQVVVIKQRIAAGDSCPAIAADYGVAAGTIGDIRGGRNWADIAPELNGQFKPYRKVSDESLREAKLAGLNGGIVRYRLNKLGWTLQEAISTPKRYRKPISGGDT